jgi:hypothetical protein
MQQERMLYKKAQDQLRGALRAVDRDSERNPSFADGMAKIKLLLESSRR